MEIILAKSAGFCFGVKRAVDTVYDEVLKSKKIYTYGPIIHNEEVVRDLESKGVIVLDDNKNISGAIDGTVIIRSHGVAKDVYDEISASGCNIVDATCPFVKKIHKTVFEKSNEGYEIIIIGNDNHPEVMGIKGWCNNARTTVINTEEAASLYEPIDDAKVCVVSQTTFNYNKFNNLVEILGKKLYDIIVVNTICNATNERQLEARKIAKIVDTMIVVGGKSSSNSQKLYEICKEECEDTYFIQTVEDLKNLKFLPANMVGITAGASTPKNIIEEVQNYVRFKF